MIWDDFCVLLLKGSAIALGHLWLLSQALQGAHSLCPGLLPAFYTFSLTYTATETSSHFLAYV